MAEPPQPPPAGPSNAPNRRQVIDLTDEAEDDAMGQDEGKERKAAEAESSVAVKRRKSVAFASQPSSAAGVDAAPAPPAAAPGQGQPHAKRPRLSNNDSFAEAETTDPLPPGQEKIVMRLSEGLRLIRTVLPNVSGRWVQKTLMAVTVEGRPDPIATVIRRALAFPGGRYPLTANVQSSGSEPPEPPVEEKKPDVPDDYRSLGYKAEERRGALYDDRSHGLLSELLPTIPVSYILGVFRLQRCLLVPAYFALLTESQGDDKHYTPLPVARPTRGASLLDDEMVNGADGETVDGGEPAVAEPAHGLAAYEEERKWLAAYINKEREEREAIKAKEEARAKALANGEGMECGCCFGEELVEDMFQCAEGHLFCKGCATLHVETKLGQQKHVIDCMDASFCTALFPDSELRRLLPEQPLRLLYRLQQTHEIATANIDGLESCPNCDFAGFIDNPEEKLFRCEAPECRKVTCRACKRPNHLPKKCEEVEAELKKDRRHAVEDAMSAALIRNCPKCKTAFIKEVGCNRMQCYKCHTVSCYICRKVVTNGYEHFDRNPANYNLPADKTKCLLWDRDEAAHDNAADKSSPLVMQPKLKLAKPQQQQAYSSPTPTSTLTLPQSRQPLLISHDTYSVTNSETAWRTSIPAWLSCCIKRPLENRPDARQEALSQRKRRLRDLMAKPDPQRPSHSDLHRHPCRSHRACKRKSIKLRCGRYTTFLLGWRLSELLSARLEPGTDGRFPILCSILPGQQPLQIATLLSKAVSSS